MINERFDQLSRRPDATFLGAGMSDSPMSKDVESFSMGAAVQDGRLADGVGVLAEEATRAREFGFSAAELDRAKKWMAAFYDRAYAERDKTESGSFAEGIPPVFPRAGTLARASRTSTALVSTLLPEVQADGGVRRRRGNSSPTTTASCSPRRRRSRASRSRPTPSSARRWSRPSRRR